MNDDFEKRKFDLERFMEETSRHIATINKKDFFDICAEEAYKLCTGSGEYEPNELMKIMLEVFSVGVAKRIFDTENDDKEGSEEYE